MTISASDPAAASDRLDRALALYRDLSVALRGQIAQLKAGTGDDGERRGQALKACNRALQAVLGSRQVLSNEAQQRREGRASSSTSTPPAPRSLRDLLSGLPQGDLDAFLAALTPNALMSLPWLFEHWAIAGHQLPPEGDWATWVILGGRGAGKTRAGAEWIRAQVEGGKPGDPGIRSRVALVGETLDEAREVMVFGPSGILACSPPDRRPEWQATRKRLVWPNGAVAQIFSASDPRACAGRSSTAPGATSSASGRRARAGLGQAAVRAAAGRPAAGGGDDDAAEHAAAAGAARRGGHGGDAGADHGEPDAPGGELSRGGDGEVRRLAARAAGARRRVRDSTSRARSGRGRCWRRRGRRGSSSFDRVVVAVDPPVTSGKASDECGIIVAGVSLAGRPQDWRRR